MTNFKLDLFDNHPIITTGENIILIDTGSPSTIHVSDTLNFCSENHVCSSNFMGISIDAISRMLGMEITTLMGVDILSKYKILLDYRGGLAQFSKTEIVQDGHEIGISTIMGIPLIQVSINNQSIVSFLDTGAKLSYLTDTITKHYKTIGIVEDFHPTVGMFQTNCYEITTTFDDKQFNVCYGNLPGNLKTLLMVYGVDAVIGYHFFDQFRVVLDLSNKRLNYKQYN